MKITLKCARLSTLLISLASGYACSAQDLVTVGYIVKQPVRIGRSGVLVESVRIYGSQDALIDSLLRSGFFDCNCSLLKAADCNLSLLKLEPIPNVESLAPGVVKIVIPKPADFINVHNRLSKSLDAASRGLRHGIIEGREFRQASQQSKTFDLKPMDPASEAEKHSEHPNDACERESKLCVTNESVSFSIGCKDLGELDISTDGEISLSLSAESTKVPKSPKRYIR